MVGVGDAGVEVVTGVLVAVGDTDVLVAVATAVLVAVGDTGVRVAVETTVAVDAGVWVAFAVRVACGELVTVATDVGEMVMAGVLVVGT